MTDKELIDEILKVIYHMYSLLEKFYEYFNKNKIINDDETIFKLSEDASDILFVYKAIIDYDNNNKIKIDEINNKIEYLYQENENLKKENEKIKKQLKNLLTINLN